MMGDVSKTWSKWLGPLVPYMLDCDTTICLLKDKVRLLLSNSSDENLVKIPDLE